MKAKTFKNDELRIAIKQSPIIVQHYISSLLEVQKFNRNIIKTAVEKIKELSKDIKYTKEDLEKAFKAGIKHNKNNPTTCMCFEHSFVGFERFLKDLNDEQ